MPSRILGERTPPVLGVIGYGERLPLEALLFEEVGDPRAMTHGDGGEHPVGRVKVPPHDGGLVFENGQEQLVRNDVQLLIAEVQSVIFRDVPEQIKSPGRSSQLVAMGW